MKKLLLTLALSMMCGTSLIGNAAVQLSANENTELAAVTNVKVEGEDGNYQITFTDTNDAANVEAYEVNYYYLNETTPYTTEFIENSGATITALLKRNLNNVTVTAISGNDDIANSIESEKGSFFYYPAMYQSGVILDNIIDENPRESYTGGVSGMQYTIPGYDFALYKSNLLTSANASGYVSNFNQVDYYVNYTTIKDHVYYFGFTYEYNEEFSTYMGEEQFYAKINTIKTSTNSYADFQNQKFTFATEEKEGRISKTFTAVESTNISTILFGLNPSSTQNTGVTSLETYSIKDVVLLDLTAAYGKYNEPHESSIDNFINNYGKIDYIELSPTAILGPQYLEASCTNPLSSSEIISNYQTLDGSSVYILESNYTENSSVAGAYFVTLAYKDQLGNVNNRMINIIVNDDVNPVIELISGGDEIVSKMSAPLTSAEILTYVKVTDNTDGNLKGSITINATNYLANQKVSGRYPVTLEVTDSAGNVATKTIYIRVENDLGPVFDAPTVIYKSEAIIFNANDVLRTINSVVDQDGNVLELFIDDTLNSDHFFVVQDTFTGNANKEGSYIVKVKAWDIQGRVSYHTFTINVVEDIPNVVMYNNTIFVSFDTTLTNKDIKNILFECGFTNKTEENAIITFPVNEYADNNYAAGQSYSVRVRYVCGNGTEENYNLIVKVLETETMKIDTSSWFSRNWVYLLIAVGGIVVLAGIASSKKRR